jgi:hypothetical protein
MHSRTDSGNPSVGMNLGKGTSTDVERHVTPGTPRWFDLSDVFDGTEVYDLDIGYFDIAVQLILLLVHLKLANHTSVVSVLVAN